MNQKDAAFYGENGGITISGGEPFMQGNAVIALLQTCKEKGLHTAVETCGYASIDVLRDAHSFVELFLWDLKDTDDERHFHYTGVRTEKILQNLAEIAQTNAKIRLRCILVNGVNTNETHYGKIADIAHTIRNFDGVEFIPYHAYSGAKSTFLGGKDNGRCEWIPPREEVDTAKEFLKSRGVLVRNT